MSTIKGNPTVSPEDVFAYSSTQGTDIGALVTTGDGRMFRYALNGAVAALQGQVYQGAAQDTTNQNPSGGLAVAAAAAGTNQVTLTGSLTLAANLMAGGFLVVNTGTTPGVTYKIKGNTVVAGAANCVVTLEDNLQSALTTASRVVMTTNPYSGIVVAPSTMTASAVGVPVSAITAAYYGWVQTHGPVGVLQTGTGTCGTALGVLQGGTIGSLAPAIAGTPILGYALNTCITGNYGLVFLTID